MELNELIQQVHATGVSFREMSRRAGRAGFPLSAQAIAKMVREPEKSRKFPDPDTLRALAAALARTPWEVYVAAGASFGFRPSYNPKTGAVSIHMPDPDCTPPVPGNHEAARD